jgi:CTP:molybdopterin cytidylyltransferase MocA
MGVFARCAPPWLCSDMGSASPSDLAAQLAPAAGAPAAAASGERDPGADPAAQPGSAAASRPHSRAPRRRYPAVLLAGDRRASRSVDGRSKAYLPVGGKPMVIHVLEALLRSPAVGDVFVVGDARRLQECLRESGVLASAAAHSRAVHVVPQRDTLYENAWHGFLRSVPPGSADPDERAILALPADVPLLLPEEVTEFVARAEATDADYVLGLTPGVALEPFAPSAGRPGIVMACFNLREGRFRQSNLHWVRPLRMGNRHYIEDMYEARHQREFLPSLWLALQVLVRELRLLWVLVPYLVLHTAGLCDRRGWTRCARLVRQLVSFASVQRAASALLRTRFALVVTSFGGAALDIDNEADREIADKQFPDWRRLQLEHAAPATLADRD